MAVLKAGGAADCGNDSGGQTEFQPDAVGVASAGSAAHADNDLVVLGTGAAISLTSGQTAALPRSKMLWPPILMTFASGSTRIGGP